MRAGETDLAAPDCVECFLYDFTDAAIITVFERRTKSLKLGLHGSTIPRVTHAKGSPLYVEETSNAGVSRELSETVRACYNADDTD